MQTALNTNDVTQSYLETVGGGFTSISESPAPGRVVWGVWHGDGGCHLRQCIVGDDGAWVQVVGLFRDGTHDVEGVAAPLFWR